MVKLMKAGHTTTVTSASGCVTIVVTRPDGTGTGTTYAALSPKLAAARAVAGLVETGWLITD